MKIKKLSYDELNVFFWKGFDFLSSNYMDHNVQMNSKWLKSYISNYLQPSQVFILGAFENDKLVGCMPMQIEEHRGTRFWNLRVLKILGNGPTDFYDIPVLNGYEEDVLSSFVDFLKTKSGWDKLHINNISTTSVSYLWLKKALLKNEIGFKDNMPNGYYWVDTKSMTWEDYTKKSFNSNNKDLFKSERRLKADGIEIFVKTFKSNIYGNLQKHLDLYEQRRASLGQKNSYFTSERRNFMKDITKLYEKENAVELSLLCSNLNEVLAFQLDWIFKGVRYHWNHAYNEDYKRYSPGKLLLKILMEKSFKDPNIYACNHMRGLSKYKSKLVDNQVYFGQVLLDNPNSIRVKLTNLIGVMFKFIRRC